jgi:hypothetical protein
VRCGVVWCGVVWCGVVWCGVVWCGVAWCGAVRCGVVWCGAVCCVDLTPSSSTRCSMCVPARNTAVCHHNTHTHTHTHTPHTRQVLVGAEDAFEDNEGLVDTGVLMDGFVPPRTAMYCMFPDEQEQLQADWDAFGAVLDTSVLRVDEGVLARVGVCLCVCDCALASACGCLPLCVCLCVCVCAHACGFGVSQGRAFQTQQGCVCIEAQLRRSGPLRHPVCCSASRHSGSGARLPEHV